MHRLPILGLLAVAGGALAMAGCGGPPAATAAAAAIPAPSSEPMPAANTYRLRWLPDHVHPITAVVPGIRMGAGRSPLRTWVQVDYAGPRRYAEVVAVNAIDGKESEPVVIYREKYGAADLEVSGSNARYFENEPFTRPRQTFVIEIHPVTDCASDTALASICTFDSVQRSFYDAARSQFYMAVWDPAHSSDRISFGEGPQPRGSGDRVYPGPSQPISDDRATTLLYVERDTARTEIQLRFRD